MSISQYIGMGACVSGCVYESKYRNETCSKKVYIYKIEWVWLEWVWLWVDILKQEMMEWVCLSMEGVLSGRVFKITDGMWECCWINILTKTWKGVVSVSRVGGVCWGKVGGVLVLNWLFFCELHLNLLCFLPNRSEVETQHQVRLWAGEAAAPGLSLLFLFVPVLFFCLDE